jgi:hypothetical protein
MTQIKQELDKNLGAMLINRQHTIYVDKATFEKCKYSCTTDQEDLRFYKGHVYYKGFEIKCP